MPQKSVNELTALLPLLIQIVGLIFAVLVDSYLDRRQKRVMLIVALLAFALVVENYMEYLLCMRAMADGARLRGAAFGTWQARFIARENYLRFAQHISTLS